MVLLSQIFTQLTADELALVFTTVFPVGLGLVAAMVALTGDTKESFSAASDKWECALRSSPPDMKYVAQHIRDLEHVHETRFADLHKDLAGIVWELSKLRADMARWQV